MVNCRGRTVIVALAFASSGHALSAQEHPIELSARATASRGTFHPGDTLTIGVRALIPSGWHLYSTTQPPGGPIATTIDVGPRGVIQAYGTIGAPPPITAADPNFGIQSEWYEDSAFFRVPARLAESTPAGKHDLSVRVGYQTCTARYCLPPREDTLAMSLAVAGAPVVVAGIASPSIPAPTPPPTTSSQPQGSHLQISQPAAAPALTAPAAALPLYTRTGSESFVLFLWLAATMGALSLLTPCVFPMVPITISYFSRTNDTSRNAAVANAVLYAGGIVVAFTGIGVGLSALMGVAGLNRFAASPALNLAIAALFIVFALSLFDVLHLALPSGLLTRMDRASSGSRFGRVATSLLMGITFALTTFTCTAPFVGTLLVSATRGDWRWPAAGLLAFSSVFAFPFLVLALVPHALARLPKSGEWMVTMKGALGFIEMAAALKFLSNADLVQGWNVFTRHTVVALWTAIGLMLVAYLVGVRFNGRTPRASARRYTLPAVAALAATLYIATGLTGRRLGELESFLPPAGGNLDGVAGRNELPWMLDDLEGGLRAAREQHKLVLIDFTGYTCTNCRWMEANMFPRPAVVSALNQFVRVRLFTDGRGDIFQRQQALERDKFQTVALPLYAIVDSLGTPRATFLGMTRDTHEFVQFLTGPHTAP